jgi:hypothetical protein
MAIDSDISGSIVAGHHDEEHTSISEIGKNQGHASDSPTGNSDHIHHEQDQHSEGGRQ